ADNYLVTVDRFATPGTSVESLELLPPVVVGKPVDALRQDVILLKAGHPCALPVPVGYIFAAIYREDECVGVFGDGLIFAKHPDGLALESLMRCNIAYLDKRHGIAICMIGCVGDFEVIISSIAVAVFCFDGFRDALLRLSKKIADDLFAFTGYYVEISGADFNGSPGEMTVAVNGVIKVGNTLPGIHHKHRQSNLLKKV